MKGWRFERQWAKIAQTFQSFWAMRSMWKSISLFVIGASLSFAIAACGGGGDNASTPTAGGNASPVAKQTRDVEVTLVGYAIPKAAHDAIIPKFVEQWKKDKGQNVTFKQSYGGSGSQTRAIIDGLEADVTHLALAADTNKLVKAGLVNADWQTKDGCSNHRPSRQSQKHQDISRPDARRREVGDTRSQNLRWSAMELYCALG